MKRGRPLQRRTPLRSGGFKPRELVVPEPRERAPSVLSAPSVLPRRRGTYTGGLTGVVVVKEDASKPGKRAPTKEEAEWMAWIVRFGCIACRLDGHDPRPTAVHHILRAGRRIGHLHTLPLCDPGHHQGGAYANMVSRHPWKARFEARYGSEEDLLLWLQEERRRELVRGTIR